MYCKSTLIIQVIHRNETINMIYHQIENICQKTSSGAHCSNFRLTDKRFLKAYK